MTLSAHLEAGGRGRRPLRVAAFTMVCDEADMLPRWLEYYGEQFGAENLMVLDDNSVDGSTDDLPCPVRRLPPHLPTGSWAASRRDRVNAVAADLLRRHDAVIFTDVDEFLIPDPARYDGLLDYLSAHSQRDVIAPLAVNVLHNPDLDSPIEAGTPLLAQRRHLKFTPRMCKPLIKRIPAAWKGGGFHGIAAPFGIDRTLLMAHLKYYDIDALRTVSHQRYLKHQSGKGHRASAWALTPDELTSRLRSWVAAPPGSKVPEFDPQEPELTHLIVRESGTGMFHNTGTQLKDMETHPLRWLPERFTTVL